MCGRNASRKCMCRRTFSLTLKILVKRPGELSSPHAVLCFIKRLLRKGSAHRRFFIVEDSTSFANSPMQIWLQGQGMHHDLLSFPERWSSLEAEIPQKYMWMAGGISQLFVFNVMHRWLLCILVLYSLIGQVGQATAAKCLTSSMNFALTCNSWKRTVVKMCSSDSDVVV